MRKRTPRRASKEDTSFLLILKILDNRVSFSCSLFVLCLFWRGSNSQGGESRFPSHRGPLSWLCVRSFSHTSFLWERNSGWDSTGVTFVRVLEVRKKGGAVLGRCRGGTWNSNSAQQPPVRVDCPSSAQSFLFLLSCVAGMFLHPWSQARST